MWASSVVVVRRPGASHSAFWRLDATMAPLGEPVNLELGPKGHQIRNKTKIPLFPLYTSTVTIYRLPQFEMNTQQGSSILSYITQNALPRDIRVRGSKPVDTTYHWACPMVINTRRTPRLTNTKIHIIQTEDPADILNQYALPEQLQDTQPNKIIETLSQNTTHIQKASKHHIRTSQHTDNIGKEIYQTRSNIR